MTKKVVAVVNSRANYARLRSVLVGLSLDSFFELKVILGATTTVSRFGSLESTIEEDGLKADYRFHSIVEGDKPSTMALSTGLGITQLVPILEFEQPDLVVTVADRFETMGTAVAASYMNIPLVHTQGGELTGSIDESVRHSISKLAHYHFPATEKSRDRLLRMGEDPKTVLVSGCPSLDTISEISDWSLDHMNDNLPGVGDALDLESEFLLVVQHPVTTEWHRSQSDILATIKAVERSGLPAIWLWPNVDAGSDAVSASLRRFRESGPSVPLHFIKNLSPKDYLRLLNRSTCIVGNSSSAIREGAFLGAPAVNIGSRQQMRERGPNVIDVPNDEEAIAAAIRAQRQRGKHPQSKLFGDGRAAKRIVRRLKQPTPHFTKVFFD